MLAAGSTIGRRYRLASLIGEGGMASVWQAEDETLKRPVAIKLLYFRAHRDPQAVVEQFLREARIAASIQHRNVIHIVDFGTTDGGVPYMVMELLHGESLADRMERSPRLAIEEVIRIASLTLRGLSAVHDAGIVHRDLKPQNIFLQSDNDAVYPKILDFGISRSLGASLERPSAIATQAGLVVGTPHYMAPEQARGEAEIDKRADIYSMGAIIYEGITGRLPFDADTPGELLMKIMSNDAPPIRSVRSDVPVVLSDCISQAMARDREHRFVDAKVFRRALQNAAESAFPQLVAARSSELPGRRRTAEPVRAVGAGRLDGRSSSIPASPAPAPAAASSSNPPPANTNAGPAPAWGDFEGLGSRSERPAGLRSLPSPAPTAPGPGRSSVPVLSGVGVSPIPSPPRSGSSASPRPPGSHARARVASAQQAPNQDLLGDNPLDVFSGQQVVNLDVDYGSRAPARPSVTRSPLPRSPARTPSTERFGEAQRRARKSRPSLLWTLPALLVIVLFLLLIAPGLFSPPAPDDRAASERESQNAATRGSDRRWNPARPADLSKLPPPLRELQF